MKAALSWATLELLPSAPYSVQGSSPRASLGLAFARQEGVHAIDGGQRQDFDAWPGDLALTMPAVPVFSESAAGGEYLLMQINDPAMLGGLSPARPRQIARGDQAAMQLGVGLRRLLIANIGSGDQLALEQQAAQWLERGLSLHGQYDTISRRYGAERQRHAQVLDLIESHLETSPGSTLSLEQLASISKLPLLRFLRSFAATTGTTPHAYITERRLQKARQLLQHSELPLAAIAADCGFSHQSHLGASLKQRLGISPLEYRRLYRRNT